jgi:hypothetical protein
MNRLGFKVIPSGLKPASFLAFYGAADAVCVRMCVVPTGLALRSHFTQDLRPGLNCFAAPRLD